MASIAELFTILTSEQSLVLIALTICLIRRFWQNNRQVTRCALGLFSIWAVGIVTPPMPSLALEVGLQAVRFVGWCLVVVGLLLPQSPSVAHIR